MRSVGALMTQKCGMSHYSRHASAELSVENAKGSVDRVHTVIETWVKTLRAVLRLHSLAILNHKRVYVFHEGRTLVRSKGFYGSSLQVTSLSTMNYAVLDNLVSPPRPFLRSVRQR
jgi:hypothetical protein